jgi:hypothetical protein
VPFRSGTWAIVPWDYGQQHYVSLPRQRFVVWLNPARNIFRQVQRSRPSRRIHDGTAMIRLLRLLPTKYKPRYVTAMTLPLRSFTLPRRHNITNRLKPVRYGLCCSPAGFDSPARVFGDPRRVWGQASEDVAHGSIIPSPGRARLRNKTMRRVPSPQMPQIKFARLRPHRPYAPPLLRYQTEALAGRPVK